MSYNILHKSVAVVTNPCKISICPCYYDVSKRGLQGFIMDLSLLGACMDYMDPDVRCSKKVVNLKFSITHSLLQRQSLSVVLNYFFSLSSEALHSWGFNCFGMYKCIELFCTEICTRLYFISLLWSTETLVVWIQPELYHFWKLIQHSNLNTITSPCWFNTSYITSRNWINRLFHFS